MIHLRPLILLACIFLTLPVPARAATLAEEVEALAGTVAVAGREQPAADLVTSFLTGLPVTRDPLGGVTVTLGSGSPRRLFACPLGEPGFVVSRIEEDGYLRISPAGRAPQGALWIQAHSGQTVVVGGAQGWRAAGVALRSLHLVREGTRPYERPLTADDLWVDAGAESAAEVAALGIRLLDPVALIRRPVRLPGDRIAAPFVRVKGSCAALIEAARAFSVSPRSGTAVFAWIPGDVAAGPDLERLAHASGPFDDVLLVSPGLGWATDEGGTPRPVPLPRPGDSLPAAGDLPSTSRPIQNVPHVLPPAGFGGSGWGAAHVGYVSLPALYPGTPVETIALADVERLSTLLLATLGAEEGRGSAGPAQATGSGGAGEGGAPTKEPSRAGRTPGPNEPPTSLLEDRADHAATADLLAALIARYGVSGAEAPVRDEVRRHLPAWAHPETDAQGNLTVTFGQGAGHVLFIAHMDEVGFRVAEILPDGRLRLEPRGGVLQPVWEAQAALVHGDRGPVPAVFEPRDGWRSAESWSLPGPLTASLGVTSAAEAEALGVHAGSTVTMPKHMWRIGRHRVLARGFDDRVGSTALLLALQRIDPAKLHHLQHRVTFAWSVGEETGLEGARVLAREIQDATRVHPVDTFVSSDSPLESRRYAEALLGRGAVLRAMDSAYFAPRELIDHFTALAGRGGIPVQVGYTGGATDGIPFLGAGAAMLPFSWPGRYSHSPVEVADLRDAEALVRLIVAAATDER